MAKLPSTIEFRHLRYFLAVVEHSSFRKAGAALGIRESAISRRIRDLEDRLGVSLFQRNYTGVRLTAAGDRFRARARAILSQIDEGMAFASQMGHGVAGQIRIGVIAPIANGLSVLLRDFHRDHEGVHIHLENGYSADHVIALRNFDLDIAFLAGARGWRECDAAMLWSEQLLVVLPGDHPLSERADISWADLADETFIVTETALGKELRALLALRTAECRRAPIIEIQNISDDNLPPLVSLGRGVALTIGATNCGVSNTSVIRPILGEKIPFWAVWSPNNGNPTFRRFLSMARARSRDVSSFQNLCNS